MGVCATPFNAPRERCCGTSSRTRSRRRSACSAEPRDGPESSGDSELVCAGPWAREGRRAHAADVTPPQIAGTERWADRGRSRIHVRDHPGESPALVLMHGFPDDRHLYDRTLPHLAGRRRVVTFDFLGWGDSDKPAGYAYTAENQTGDLDAVIDALRLDAVVLVAHDASGP